MCPPANTSGWVQRCLKSHLPHNTSWHSVISPTIRSPIWCIPLFLFSHDPRVLVSWLYAWVISSKSCSPPLPVLVRGPLPHWVSKGKWLNASTLHSPVIFENYDQYPVLTLLGSIIPLVPVVLMFFPPSVLFFWVVVPLIFPWLLLNFNQVKSVSLLRSNQWYRAFLDLTSPVM